jgi:putative alpha-1,2-mannosidase
MCGIIGVPFALLQAFNPTSLFAIFNTRLPSPMSAQNMDVMDLTQYVLPLYTCSPHHSCSIANAKYSTGTQNGGNMFPGVSRPFGVVKLGPDMYTGSDAYSGYLPTGDITAFTLTHESGTGGAPKYGVVAQQPAVGNVTNPLAIMSQARATADEAVVGYYKSTLESNVTVELGATEHAGILHYTFPAGQIASVVVDVSHVLPSFRGQGLGQNYTGGNMTLASDGHYEGGGTYNNGWNRCECSAYR